VSDPLRGSSVIGAPVEAYNRHVGRYGKSLAAGMIRVAGLEPAQRALDVGCGPGALTIELAELLGAENVAALDPSERFAETCRERAPGADVRLGTAEQMPFDDARFDAVLAQLVVDGMEDAPRGVAEMRRVARPGGVLVACVWDFENGMPMLAAMWDAALALDAERARSLGAGVRKTYAQPDKLEQLWQESGLAEVELGRVDAGAEYADFEDLWYPFAAGVGGIGKFLAALDEREQERFKRDAWRRLGEPQGAFALAAQAFYVRGVVVR
jgi:ubiquinone/menaquinone biosynthesis C-methylase UbiE